MIKYAKTHEYACLNGKTAKVGISAHAAEELGDITYVDLPQVGKIVKKGDTLCAVESVKSASDVFVPVSGKIIAVNSELDGKPELINDSAEEKGWIVEIELSDVKEMDSLLDEAQYKAEL